jgi:AraC-like DNA-binding protein
MEKRQILNKLVNRRDFEALKERISIAQYSLSQDFSKHITFLDYHVIFEQSRINGVDFYNKMIRYSFDSPIFKEGKMLIHPAHLFEMEQNIKKVQYRIDKITVEDIQILNNNEEFRIFCNNLLQYKESNRDSHIFFSTIKAFKTAIFFNSEPKIHNIFKKAVVLFYYDKLYVNTYQRIIDYIKEKQIFLSISEVAQKLGKNPFKYNEVVYKKCINRLSAIRSKLYNQNFIDSICAATCINFRDVYKDHILHFFTSQAPYEAFVRDKEINGNSFPIVRDAITISLLKKSIDKHKNNFDEIKRYLKNTENNIEYYLNLEDKKYLQNKNKIYSELCYDFRDELFECINKYCDIQCEPLLELMIELNQEEISNVLEDIKLFGLWSSAMFDFIDKLNAFSDSTSLKTKIVEGKSQALSKLKEFLDFFYSFLEEDKFMNEQYENISKTIEKVKKEHYFKNPQSIIEAIQAIVYSLDTISQDEIEKSDLQELVKKAKRLPSIKEKAISILEAKMVEAGKNKKFIVAGYIQGILENEGS